MKRLTKPCPTRITEPCFSASIFSFVVPYAALFFALDRDSALFEYPRYHSVLNKMNHVNSVNFGYFQFAKGRAGSLNMESE